jgi:hypothetical protein
MRITSDMRHLVSSQGIKGLFKIIEEESFDLNKKLKKASTINEIKKLQGSLGILDDLLKLNG